jgi:CheY-like chemotaxis protein
MARILVVDDNEEFRASIKDLLETNGYDVVLAVDGEDGIRLFEQQGCDLVVCDVFMPKKDGLETITEILKISPAPRLSQRPDTSRRPPGGRRI